MAGSRYPADWLDSLGEIVRFCGRVMGLVYTGRVFQFFGEALRQAGILILGSTIVIWGLVFILGLQCGIEGAYFNRSVGAPAYAGVFAAWCDLREVIPYAFGYMMAAKVGTGIVAELGAMRISDEIDAMEVMGIPPVTFLAATRLLAAWMTLPFMYLAAIGVGFFASWLAVVEQIGDVSSGGYFLIFWMFQNPPDLIFSVIKGMVDGDGDRARRLLLRLHRLRRTGRGGDRDREVDGAQHRLGPHHRDDGNPGLLGRQPEGADRRLDAVQADHEGDDDMAEENREDDRRTERTDVDQDRETELDEAAPSAYDRARTAARPTRRGARPRRGDPDAAAPELGKPEQGLHDPRRRARRQDPYRGTPARSATTAARTRSRSSTSSSSSARPGSRTASTSACPTTRSRWCSARRAPASRC